MKTIYKLTLIIAIALSAFACEKEIDLNYKSVDKIYVIEGFTNDTASFVSITRTTDMYEPIDTTSKGRVTNANVIIKDSQGIEHTLLANDSGIYVNNTLRANNPLENYTLSVNIDQKTYESKAQLMPRAEIDTLLFCSQTIMSPVTMYSCHIIMTVDPMKESYYHYILRHNGKRIITQIHKEEAGKQTKTNIFIPIGVRNSEGKLILDKDTERELKEGDTIELEMRQLDVHTYHYLASVYAADQTNYNPLPHFTGGALGYYLPYFISKHTETFLLDKVLSLD